MPQENEEKAWLLLWLVAIVLMIAGAIMPYITAEPIGSLYFALAWSASAILIFVFLICNIGHDAWDNLILYLWHTAPDKTQTITWESDKIDMLRTGECLTLSLVSKKLGENIQLLQSLGTVYVSTRPDISFGTINLNPEAEQKKLIEKLEKEKREEQEKIAKQKQEEAERLAKQQSEEKQTAIKHSKPRQNATAKVEIKSFTLEVKECKIINRALKVSPLLESIIYCSLAITNNGPERKLSIYKIAKIVDNEGNDYITELKYGEMPEVWRSNNEDNYWLYSNLLVPDIPIKATFTSTTAVSSKDIDKIDMIALLDIRCAAEDRKPFRVQFRHIPLSR